MNSKDITATIAARIANNVDKFPQVVITGVANNWRFDGGYAGNFVSTGTNKKSWKRVYKKVTPDSCVRIYSLDTDGRVKITSTLVLRHVPRYVKVVCINDTVEIYWDMSESSTKLPTDIKEDLVIAIPSIGCTDYEKTFYWRKAV